MAQIKPRLTTDAGPRYEQCQEDALRLLRKSADEWSKGDPESPSPEDILRSILKLFEEQKFLRRPW
jgi:hypothetical protein